MRNFPRKREEIERRKREIEREIERRVREEREEETHEMD